MSYFLARSFGHLVNVVALPATSRYESHANAGLKPSTIYEINQYGHGVIVGGGNLYENGELEVSTDALATLDAPLMLFSLSMGRIYNRRAELVRRTDSMAPSRIVALNAKAGQSVARDKATADVLRELGVKHAVLGGCPTLFVDRMRDRIVKQPDDYGETVFVSVRNPRLMSVPLIKQSQVHGDVARIVAFLRGRGHRDVRILCHDYRDIAFAASFSGVDYVYTDDVGAYLYLLSTCRLNVTYRLHSALPCASYGRPFIKISYDERALSAMETVGYGDWNIDMVKADDVAAAVADRYDRLDELPGHRDRVQPLWNQLHDVMGKAFDDFAADVRAFSGLGA